MRHWIAKKPSEDHHDKDDWSDSLSDPTRRKNRLWFYSEVTPETIQAFVTQLHEAEVEALRMASELGVADIPVHVHIHSYGGDVFSGMAAMDAILETRKRVPVHTHIEGAAASAATLMSVAGTRRTIGQHSFILIHQISSSFWGKFEEWKDEMKNNDLLMKTVVDFYVEHARMDARHVRQVLKKDLWFDAKRAHRLGLVDEIR